MTELVLSASQSSHPPSRPPLFRMKYPISLETPVADPELVNWQTEFKVSRLLFALLALLLLSATYFLFSAPNLYLHLVYARTPGRDMELHTDWIAGFIPAIGSMHIINTGDRLFANVGFASRERRDLTFFIATYFAVVCMLLCDFFCSYLAAHGRVLDVAAVHGNGSESSQATSQGRSEETPRLLGGGNDSPYSKVDALMAEEVWELVFPLTVSVLLFDMISDVGFPSWVGRHVVRSRKFSTLLAEQLTAPPRFDFAIKYQTVLITFFAFAMWLRLETVYAGFLVVVLLLLLVGHYVLCAYASVRLYARTSVTNNSAARVAFGLWSVGLAQILLAAANYGGRVWYLNMEDVWPVLLGARRKMEKK
eukprot:g8298.t1